MGEKFPFTKRAVIFLIIEIVEREDDFPTFLEFSVALGKMQEYFQILSDKIKENYEQ